MKSINTNCPVAWGLDRGWAVAEILQVMLIKKSYLFSNYIRMTISMFLILLLEKTSNDSLITQMFQAVTAMLIVRCSGYLIILCSVFFENMIQ